MARPKLHRGSANLDAEIARIQRETEARLHELQAERREAEAREDRRRGEVVRTCLERPDADELRRVLAGIVGAKDRPLFGLSAPHGASHIAAAVAPVATDERAAAASK